MNGIASVFLGPLQGLLSTFQSERHYKDDKKDEALNAIHKALLETKKYIELSNGVEDREKVHNGVGSLIYDCDLSKRGQLSALRH